MSSPATPSRRDFGLAVVLAAALAFRLLYWFFIMPATVRGLVVDEPEYFGGAVVFASGRGFSFWDTFLWTRPPLYPATLGSIFALFGHDELLPARLLQLGLNLASIAVLYLIARCCFDRRVAFVTGLLAAFYLPFTILPYMMLGETLFILLLGLFFLTLSSSSALSTQHAALSIAFAGLLLGLATLVRGTTLVYIPLAALVLWRSQRSRLEGETEITAPPTDSTTDKAEKTEVDDVATESPQRGFGGEGRHTSTSLGNNSLNSKLKTQNSKLLITFFLTAILTLAPWTVRNYFAYGYFIPTDTTGGYNFWLGANGVRDGGRLAADLLTIPNQGVRQSYAYARGFELLRADPLGFGGKGLKEMNDLWAGNFTAEERFTRGYTHGLVPAAHLLASIVLDDTLYLIIVPFAILGLLFAPRHRLRGYVLMWVLVNFALAFIFFAVVRFRLAVLFFLLPYAAWALLHWRDIWMVLRRAPSPPAPLPKWERGADPHPHPPPKWERGALAAVLIVAFLIANLPGYPLTETMQGVAMWGSQRHILAGDAALAAADPQMAAREYNQADPKLPETQTARASILLLQGDYAQAQTIGSQLDADYWGRYLILGAAARQQGQDATGYFSNRVVRDDYAAASDWAWAHLMATDNCILQIGNEGKDMGELRGFAAAEKDAQGQPFRWTVQRDSSVRLCAVKSPTATLSLRMKAYRPAPLPPLTVHVGADDVDLGNVTLTEAWADFTFVVTPSNQLAPISVVLSSDTFVPGGSDPRRLGFMLAEAKIEP